jgi:magnesium chelatase family protein
MKLAVVYSRASLGVDAPLVTVEAHISQGLPGFTIVGLPETAVKESKDRVRSAILNSHFEFPSRRITINLGPADLPKEGGRFDLPIALGILAASQQIPANTLHEYEFVGELALSGELRPVYGILPVALSARKANRTLVVPQKNADEAVLPGDNTVLAADHLLAVSAHLARQTLLSPYIKSLAPTLGNSATDDLSDVKGQMHAKRALEITAAGGHALLMVGPPGTGKTMLASRLPSILPPLSIEEALEVVAIHSLLPQQKAITTWTHQRPFRAPHHTASAIALVGGGSYPKPGEISLAHNGILFLDELPEFDKRVLEVLREPLESGTILISRAARQTEFPARFQLVAAMNPCPCGYLSDPKGRCRCTQEQVSRYRARISGPLLDRIDLQVEVPALPIETLSSWKNLSEESSEIILERVKNAVQKQYKRSLKLNARLSNRDIQGCCVLKPNAEKFINQAIEKLGLSARSYHRILRVARTIADLDDHETVEMPHLSEALSFKKISINT